MVGVDGVRVVAAHEHRFRDGTLQVLTGAAQRCVQTRKRVGEKRRHGTLLGVRADLLVVEARENRDAAIVLGGEERFERGVCAGQVVEFRGGGELARGAPDAWLLTVDEEQVARDDVALGDSQLVGDYRVEGGFAKRACGEERAEVDLAIRRELLVDVALDMRRHAGDERERLGRFVQAAFHAIAAFHHHAARNSEGPIEPRVVDGAAVHLHIESLRFAWPCELGV